MTDFYVQDENTGNLHKLSDVLSGVGAASVEVSGFDVSANAPLTGQAKIAATGTRVALSATSVVIPGGVIFVTARLASTYVTVGGEAVTNTADGTGNGQTLKTDESVAIIAADLADVYINGTKDDWVSWSAG